MQYKNLNVQGKIHKLQVKGPIIPIISGTIQREKYMFCPIQNLSTLASSSSLFQIQGAQFLFLELVQ